MELDMSEYHPYAEMGKTCETRHIEHKRVIWPYLDRDFTEKFRGRVLSRADIDEVTELWRVCYPEVYGSSQDWILYPQEYAQKVALKDSWADDASNKAYCITVVEDTQEGKLASATMYAKTDKDLHIAGNFAAVHPDYRQDSKGPGIWLKDFYYLGLLEKESNAEYLTGFCETWHTTTQYLMMKRGGWKIAGIFPGRYTRWCGDQREYRGCTVHFYKFVGKGESYATKPKEWCLLPGVQKLWNLMEEINEESDDQLLRQIMEQMDR